MHASGKKKASDVPAVHAVDAANQDHLPLIDFVKRFARSMRGRPERFILDGFDHEFYIVFNFEECPESPESVGTCDIHVVPLAAEDSLAAAIRVVADANKFGVMRFLAAIGIKRFNDRVKSAFYQTSNPLRA